MEAANQEINEESLVSKDDLGETVNLKLNYRSYKVNPDRHNLALIKVQEPVERVDFGIRDGESQLESRIIVGLYSDNKLDLFHYENYFSLSSCMEGGDKMVIVYDLNDNETNVNEKKSEKDYFNNIGLIRIDVVKNNGNGLSDREKAYSKRPLTGNQVLRIIQENAEGISHEPELAKEVNSYIEAEYENSQRQKSLDPHLNKILETLNTGRFPVYLMNKEKEVYEKYKKLMQSIF